MAELSVAPKRPYTQAAHTAVECADLGCAVAQAKATRRLAGHQAAVKALAWCPWESNLLATGGGSSDRSIKTWNTSTGVQLSSTDTGSQVPWAASGPDAPQTCFLIRLVRVEMPGVR